MRKKTVWILSMVMLLLGCNSISISVLAADSTKTIDGVVYEFGEKDVYDMNNGQMTSTIAKRFYVIGDIESTSMQNGVVSFAVNSGNLDLYIDKSFGQNLYDVNNEEEWHIVEDKSKTVDATKLDENIGTGAVIIQTSKDGKSWINATTFVNLSASDKEADGSAVYSTTNVQLTNGCYYRILVAYKMRRRVVPSKILFVTKNNYEYKKCIEEYKFYAYDKNVDRSEMLNIDDAYEFGDVYRTAKFEGYSGTEEIDNEDPHNGWTIGHFYVSGYTDDTDYNGDTVFLKEVGDKITLWFNLEQDINKCNGNTAIGVSADPAGSDQYFGTPTMDFGRGTLIVRKTDSTNKKEVNYYTNYLEASATVGANTKVALFEEGDYEIALDYELTYEKIKVLGKSVLPKTLHYRMFFEFSVRNGDCKLFIRDAETDQFLNNANIAENGFYIDLAQSKYLMLLVTRDVMTDSLDGLVADTKFNGAAKEGRSYTDEGVYTISATNKYTGAKTEKKIYVGNSDILKAYVKTGLSISEINEKVAAGAYIEADGTIVEPEPEPETIVEEVTIDETVSEDEEDIIVEEPKAIKEVTEEVTELSQVELSSENEQGSDFVPFIVTIAIVMVVVFSIFFKSKGKKTSLGQGDKQK